MAEDKVYRSVMGMVFKDPVDDKAGTKTVRRILVSAANVPDVTIKVTLFDENWHKVPVKRGDVVYASGVFTKRNVDGTTYRDITANEFAVLGTSVREDDGNRSTSSGDDDDPF